MMGIKVMKMEGHSSSVWCMTFLPNGMHIVSGSDDKTVQIWDVTMGTEVMKMDKMKAMRNKKGRLKLRGVPKQTNVGVFA